MMRRPVIAVVDDEDSVRRSLLRLLPHVGFSVRAYASVRDFLQTLSSGRPDCVVVDWQMPGLTGIDLCRQLAAPGGGVPTLVLTANDDPSVREACRQLGVKALLLKPVDGDTLLAAIRAALELPVQSPQQAIEGQR